MGALRPPVVSYIAPTLSIIATLASLSFSPPELTFRANECSHQVRSLAERSSRYLNGDSTSGKEKSP